MLRLSFDNETWRFDDSCTTPPPVCMSYAEIVETGPGRYELGRADVLPYLRGAGLALDALHAWLTMAGRGECLLIGANTAYDVFTSIVGAYQRSQSFGKELFGLWVKAYDADMVTDVFNRQKMLDLAIGCYRFERLPSGASVNHQYNLAGLARRHIRKELDKTNPWRVRFGELDGLTVDQYPPLAREYSLEDSVSTSQVWIAQETSGVGGLRDVRIAQNFPGHDPLKDEFNQARAALALSAISNYGIRTNPQAVEVFEAKTREAFNECRDELVKAGLIRREYVRDAELVTAYLKQHGLTDRFERTPGGALSIKGETLRATGDAALRLLADWRLITKRLEEKDEQAQRCVDHLVAVGLVRCDESRDTRAASWRLALSYANPAALGLEGAPRPVPRTPAWDPWDPITKKGDPKHLPGSIECVALDKDACDASEDGVLQTYAEYTSLGKLLSTDIPNLRLGTHLPIHTRYEVLLDTGRTSSSKPNIQNPPRAEGVRECFEPRPGCCFISCDYPQLELSTLSQICYWVFGHSVMGDTLKAGKDIHLQTATHILHRSYDDLKANKGTPEVKQARTLAKPCAFGVPGGLGKQKFADFSYRGYGIRLSLEEAADLIKMFKEAYPEIAQYFKWIESQKATRKTKFTNEDGEEAEEYRHNMVMPGSGLLRAGATYCASANNGFQGLGAHVAKRALWYVFKGQHGFSELGDADPLVHSRTVNFIHDEIFAEAPVQHASAAGYRIATLMDRAAKEIMPDTYMHVEPCLMDRWSKSAETVWMDPDGCATDDVKAAARDEHGQPVLAVWSKNMTLAPKRAA